MQLNNAKPLVAGSKIVNCFLCKKNRPRKKCRMIPISVKPSKGFEGINTEVWVCKKHHCTSISQ